MYHFHFQIPRKKRRVEERRDCYGLPIVDLDMHRVGVAQVLPGTDGDSLSDQLCDRIDDALSSLVQWRNSGGESECE